MYTSSGVYKSFRAAEEDKGKINNYLLTLINPFAGAITFIPDNNMTPTILKSVKFTGTLTSAGTNQGFLFMPFHSNRLRGRIYGYDSVTQTHNFLSEFIPDEDLSQNFRRLRFISGGVKAVSATLTGANFTVQGIMNGTSLQDPPNLRTVQFPQIVSYARDNSSSMGSVPVATGLVAIAAPDDEHTFVVPETETTYRTNDVQVLSSDYAVNPTGWNVAALPLNTLVPIFSGSTAGIVPPNTWGWVKTRGSITLAAAGAFLPPLPGNIDIIKVCLTYIQSTADPVTYGQVLTTKTAVVAATNVVSALNDWTISFSYDFYSVADVVDIQVSFAYSTSVVQTQLWSLNILQTNKVSVDFISNYEVGNHSPGAIIAWQNLNTGQQIAFGGVSNYEVVPDSNLSRNIATGYDRVDDIMDMPVARLILSQAHRHGIRFMYDLTAYNAMAEKGWFYEFAHRDSSVYRAAVKIPAWLRTAFDVVKPALRTLAPSLGAQIGISNDFTQAFNKEFLSATHFRSATKQSSTPDAYIDAGDFECYQSEEERKIGGYKRPPLNPDEVGNRDIWHYLHDKIEWDIDAESEGFYWCEMHGEACNPDTCCGTITSFSSHPLDKNIDHTDKCYRCKMREFLEPKFICYENEFKAASKRPVIPPRPQHLAFREPKAPAQSYKQLIGQKLGVQGIYKPWNEFQTLDAVGKNLLNLNLTKFDKAAYNMGAAWDYARGSYEYHLQLLKSGVYNFATPFPIVGKDVTMIVNLALTQGYAPTFPGTGKNRTNYIDVPISQGFTLKVDERLDIEGETGLLALLAACREKGIEEKWGLIAQFASKSNDNNIIPFYVTVMSGIPTKVSESSWHCALICDLLGLPRSAAVTGTALDLVTAETVSKFNAASQQNLKLIVLGYDDDEMLALLESALENDGIIRLPNDYFVMDGYTALGYGALSVDNVASALLLLGISPGATVIVEPERTVMEQAVQKAPTRQQLEEVGPDTKFKVTIKGVSQDLSVDDLVILASENQIGVSDFISDLGLPSSAETWEEYFTSKAVTKKYMDPETHVLDAVTDWNKIAKQIAQVLSARLSTKKKAPQVTVTRQKLARFRF